MALAWASQQAIASQHAAGGGADDGSIQDSRKLTTYPMTYPKLMYHFSHPLLPYNFLLVFFFH